MFRALPLGPGPRGHGTGPTVAGRVAGRRYRSGMARPNRPRNPPVYPSHRGATLLELVVLLAVTGLLVGAAWLLGRPSAARPLARALQAMLIEARLTAILGGRPVALVWLPGRVATEPDASGAGASDTGAFETRVHDALAEVCADGRPLERLEADRFGRARVESWPEGGVVWLPTGAGRTCRGGGVFNGSYQIVAGGARYRVSVASAGRVRLEALR